MGIVIHIRHRHRRNTVRCVFVKVHITPTKVTKMEASAKSNPVSGKDFNSFNGLLKMKTVNPYVSVSKAVSKILLVNISLMRMKPRTLHWMLTPHINEDSGRVRLWACSWHPQMGPSLQF